MNKVIEVLNKLEQEVQELRENGEQDLRSVLYSIHQLKEENKEYVPFVSEVTEFNSVMGKDWQNRDTPTINDKDAQFVIDFIDEELQELKEAVKEKDIVEVLDAICDIAYVGLGNAVNVFGLRDKILPAYAEVQASNLSKICKDESEAQDTVISMEEKTGDMYYYKAIKNHFVVFRNSDDKVGKSISYFRPNLSQFFTKEELNNL
jgi:predicted HAD superfamily Cof-like phosphohydrolase